MPNAVKLASCLIDLQPHPHNQVALMLRPRRVLALLASAILSALGPAAFAGETMRVYIGTYTQRDSKGIYLLELDLETGALSDKGLVGEARNPSFLAIHPDRKHLYSVNEVSDIGEKKVGGVTAFEIDADSGKLKELNGQPSGGAGPCYVAIDRSGKNVLVANYGGGSVASLPIDADGKLKPAKSVIQHEGSSVDKSRQKGPHAHSINVSPDNEFAIAADLGLDKLLVYRLDADRGTLTPNEPPSTSTVAGGGPRHFAFHPNGKFAYTNLEMSLEVTALLYHPQAGVLAGIQTLSTVPEGTDRQGNSTAEVQVHPSGKFVYVSNRGHNTIAMFKVDPKSGMLTAIGHQSTEGRIPRNFGIDPSGKFLLAANQDSDDVVSFRIDAEKGTLTPVGSKVKVSAPVCVKFFPKD
ncbi:lactonase family protein [Planctomyces sp. SH-PL14]|uniref:lactonase family protein n=1 Tax=Planctomyces sp. SH-PL14 TaxID=1632864 RepID=UPI00078D5561|nr:lactonase family protein [Planctomyces sp. SH-PL14]AMV19345.1 6-phosphogluconolactonase [Planctomyces sp. SH-PL14]